MNEQFLIAEGLHELEDSYEEFAFDSIQLSLDIESDEILLWNDRRRQGTKCSRESCTNLIAEHEDMCQDCAQFYGFWETIMDYRDKCIQEGSLF